MKLIETPVFWLTGMSGAGKSTLARDVQLELHKIGFTSEVVDGDQLRLRDPSQVGFDNESIKLNGKRVISEVEKIRNEVDVIFVTVITPFQETRLEARARLGPRCRFIWIDCPLSILTKRDTKGLYLKQLNGDIDNLIGVSPGSPFEIPVDADLRISTDKPVNESAEELCQYVTRRINFRC